MIQVASTIASGIVFWTVGIIYVSATAPKTGVEFFSRLGMLCGMAGSGAATMAFLYGAVEATLPMLIAGALADVVSLLIFDRRIGLRAHLVETYEGFKLWPVAVTAWWHEKLQHARRAVESRK